jgi:hypothetical protein
MLTKIIQLHRRTPALARHLQLQVYLYFPCFLQALARSISGRERKTARRQSKAAFPPCFGDGAWHAITFAWSGRDVWVSCDGAATLTARLASQMQLPGMGRAQEIRDGHTHVEPLATDLTNGVSGSAPTGLRGSDHQASRLAVVSSRAVGISGCTGTDYGSANGNRTCLVQFRYVPVRANS